MVVSYLKSSGSSKKSAKHLSLGGAMGDKYEEDASGNLIKVSSADATMAAALAAPVAAPVAAQVAPVAAVAETPVGAPSQEVSQMGGKKRGRKSTKKGGDAGATAMLSAGTLLLIQAATKELLKRSKSAKSASRKKQSGGQVIQSVPAPYSATGGAVDGGSLAVSMFGGSVCGGMTQAGGKRRGRARKTVRGGALNTTGELDAAFPSLSMAGVAQSTVPHVAPYQVAMAAQPIEQAGGKRRGRPRKTVRGGACPLGMADLKDAFMPVPAGAIPFPATQPPTTPDTMTDLKAQTGGKKRRNAKKH